MPRDVNGNYSLPAGNPVVTLTNISSSWANSTLQDIATALTNSLSVDGSVTTAKIADDAVTPPKLNGVNGDGFVARTSISGFANRSIAAPAAGITITNGDGVSGNPTLALADDLAAVEGLATTGFSVRTASNTWATRSITSTTLTITNGDGVSGNVTIELGGDVAAIEGISGTGLAVRTAANTWTTRSVAGTANKITVTDGDGVAGNITLTLPDAITLVTPTVTGNMTIGGTLGVTGTTSLGAATVSSTLGVTGAATLSGGVTVTGNVDATGNLLADGYVEGDYMRTAAGDVISATSWVNFNGTGTVAIRDSYNVSSITDNGPGDYTVNFATAMADINYSIMSPASGSPNFSYPIVAVNYDFSPGGQVAPTVNGYRIATVASTGGALDFEYVYGLTHGGI